MLPKEFPFFSHMRTESSARMKMITIPGTIYEALIHAGKSACVCTFLTINLQCRCDYSLWIVEETEAQKF